MGFLKKQLLSVIEWVDDTNDTLMYKYQLKDREEIMNSSTLVVRESQVAIFVHKGEIADVLGPGTYKLATENIPFLTKILSLPTGFNSRIKADVYFVSTKRFIGLKWGTQNPIMMRDVDFGNIRLRGYGTFAVKVENPTTFMKECFGTRKLFTINDVATHYKSTLVQILTDSIAESKISALDLAANYKNLSKIVEKRSKSEFNSLGLKVSNFIIENLSLPEEVEKTLDERTKMGVIGDKMKTYAQYKTANAIEGAANNPNGSGLAGLGVGLGAGVGMGEMFRDSFNGMKDETKPVIITCNKCGASISGKSKFCPECGEPQANSCPKCGEPVSKGAKFCPNCGEPLKRTGGVCKKCGTVLDAGAKFCPNCGEKA